MNVRNYQPGDEVEQVAIYNEAAAALPKFKTANVDEIRRRCRATDFDPQTRFYAEDGGQVVGYAAFHRNGRVSYPWCRPGHERAAEPLFQGVLQAMTGRGMRSAFAAYRKDWPAITSFFQERGFRLAREMINFVLDLTDTPTTTRLRTAPTLLRPIDVPAILPLAPEALRVTTPAELEKHFFHNPYFSADSAYVIRARGGDAPLAVGILVEDPAYADPKMIDANMPCFRLGAFGTEGMQTKRIRGMFSFLARNNKEMIPLALDLMIHAVARLEQTEVAALAAQVPSDVSHLLNFYKRYFRQQGSFPVFERALQ